VRNLLHFQVNLDRWSITREITRRRTATNHLRCANCHSGFSYDIHFSASGQDYSPYGLRNAAAKSGAYYLARLGLEKRRVKVLKKVRPVHCPTCGFYQPEMMTLLPKGVDPNEMARLRVVLPLRDYWEAVCKTNTISAYENFIRK
jgi:hypothetical protein